jgi:hypothetical protein
MEYWPARIATRSLAGGSVGVLRQVRMRALRVEDAEGAEDRPDR